METHFINIKLFDINNFDIFSEKDGKIYAYYNYNLNNSTNLNLLINNINDYYFKNNTLYFNLENDYIKLILQEMTKKLHTKCKIDYDVRDDNEPIEYKYDFSYDNLLIFKSKNVNINLNQDKKDILTEINNNKYIINIGITFDNIICYASSKYYFNIKLSFIKIKEKPKIIYLYDLNKIKKLTIKNDKLKNVEKIEENKNKVNNDKSNSNPKIKDQIFKEKDVDSSDIED